MSRRFEFVAGPSAKFWEIDRIGSVVTVRFGRIGTKGQTQVNDMSAESVAMEHVGRLILEKRKKGYREIAATADTESLAEGRRSSLPSTAPLPEDGAAVIGSVRLPEGRRIRHDSSFGEAATDQPVLWLTDEPVARAGALLADLRRGERGSGLVAFLAEHAGFDAARPWTVGEFVPADHREIALVDLERTFRDGWNNALPGDDDGEGREHMVEMLAPFGLDFPGLAPPADAPAPLAPPSGLRRLFSIRTPAPTDRWAHTESETGLRIGLVAADRPADVITVLGWLGSANYHEETAALSAILRSWEERFSAEVVKIGFDTLTLVVERPLLNRDHALAVAAEHYAFCPDNVEQGTETLVAYADLILLNPIWTFWWD